MWAFFFHDIYNINHFRKICKFIQIWEISLGREDKAVLAPRTSSAPSPPPWSPSPQWALTPWPSYDIRMICTRVTCGPPTTAKNTDIQLCACEESVPFISTIIPTTAYPPAGPSPLTRLLMVVGWRGHPLAGPTRVEVGTAGGESRA